MALTLHLPLRLYQAAVVLGAMLLGLLAAVEPKMALAAAFGMVVVAMVFADLAIGLAVFTFVAFLEAVPVLTGASAPKLVGMLLLLSWLGTMAIRRRGADVSAPLQPGLVAALILLPVWAAVTILWALEGSGVIDSAQRWALNLTLVPIAFTAIRRTEHVEWLFIAFVAGVIMSAALGILGVFSDTSDEIGAGSGRLGGAGINANQLGGLLVCATTFAAALALARRRSVGGRALWLGLSMLCAIALASTLSRGAIIGMIVAFLFAPVIAGRGRRLPAALLSILLAGSIALAVVALLPATATQRLTASDRTGTGRTDIWRVGWRMVQDRPLLGVGAGNFDDTTVKYLVQPGAIQRDEFILDSPKVAHNIYLHVLAELGAIGLVLFLSIIGICLGSALSAARRFQRQRDPDGELMARALSLALIGLLAADFFSSQLYSKQLWLLLAVGPALLAVARRGDA
jgi:O-antigen ligase